MTETRYHLIFDGRLQPGVSLQRARNAIRARFKLSDRQLERLFSGEPVTVKRDLDATSAARYQRAFLEAGAIVERRAIEPETSPPSAATDPDAHQGPTARALGDVPQTATLQLLPPGTPVGEEQRGTTSAPPDTSRFSLASPEDSGLEDCAPQPNPPRSLDLSRFQLLPLDAEPRVDDATDTAKTAG